MESLERVSAIPRWMLLGLLGVLSMYSRNVVECKKIPMKNPNECFPYGCPYVARDLLYDDNYKDFLEQLQAYNESLSEADRLEDILEELSTSGNHRMVTMSMTGRTDAKKGELHQSSQDRSMLISPYINQPYYQLVGVLDGHGTSGAVIAESVQEMIPRLLAKRLGIRALLPRLYESIDEHEVDAVVRVLKNLFVEVEEYTRLTKWGGSTASFALQLGSKIYLANAGDSTTIVASHASWNDEVHILGETRRDWPHLPGERERIEAAGAQVKNTTRNGVQSSKLVYKAPYSKVKHELEMSRCIGDISAPGVIAEPTVEVFDIPTLLAEAKSKSMSSTRSNVCEPQNSESDGVCTNEENESQACTAEDNEPKSCQSSDANGSSESIPENGRVRLFIVSASKGVTSVSSLETIAKRLGKSFAAESMGSRHLHASVAMIISKLAGRWRKKYNGDYREDMILSTARVYWRDR